jgi:hypothetical protein
MIGIGMQEILIIGLLVFLLAGGVVLIFLFGRKK